MPNVDELRLAAEKAKQASIEAYDAWHNEMKRIHPIQPGDVIVSKTGEQALVTIHTIEFGRVKVNAVMRNKDGEFGKRVAPLWRSEWDYADEKNKRWGVPVYQKLTETEKEVGNDAAE